MNRRFFTKMFSTSIIASNVIPLNNILNHKTDKDIAIELANELYPMFIFEFNDKYARDTFKAIAKRYTDRPITCDETINTPRIINNHQFAFKVGNELIIIG